MKRTYVVCVIYLLAATFILAQSNPPSITGPSTKAATANASQPDPKAQAKVLETYGKLPLTFEPNQGQTDAQVKFLSRTSAYTLFLTQNEAVITLPAKKQPPRSKLNKSPVETRLAASPASATEKVLRMKLRHANPSAKITGEDELPGTSNYFIGNDPKKWRTSVPTYAKVRYEQIYSGIDLVYYGNQRQLEYDFIVAPGANPSRIAFDIRGASQIRRNPQGDLVIRIGMTTKPGEAEIRWHKPLVYQEKNGTRQEIAAGYSITGANRVGFEVAKYDASRPLYIDPLIYSTGLAGSAGGPEIAVDSAGSAYVTNGMTVAKLNPAGSALVYSIFLSGTGVVGGSPGIAVDSAGNAYVTGSANSSGFPTTPGAFQTSCGNPNSCAFVAVINPEGTALGYSSYLGGSIYDYGTGIAVDGAGDAYVTGATSSPDFPTTPGAFQPGFGGGSDAFVAEFNPSGSGLVYSSYLGGSGGDYGSGIAVDSAGNAYITGNTYSMNFPAAGCYQYPYGGYGNAFVTKVNPSGSTLGFSFCISGDIGAVGNGIAADSVGNAYATGFLVCKIQSKACGHTGITHTFVYKFGDPSYKYSFSGGYSSGSGIGVDSAGNAYITGSGVAPTTPGAWQRTCSRTLSGAQETGRMHDLAKSRPDRQSGCQDPFLTKISPSGSLAYSTYLSGYGGDSGVAVDNTGNAYLAGDPVTKFDPVPATTIKLTSSPNPSIYGEAVTFTAAVSSKAGSLPNGETVAFMNSTTLLGTGTLTSGTAALTTSTLEVGTTTVTAVYAGDSDFAASTSKAVKQVVKKATN